MWTSNYSWLISLVPNMHFAIYNYDEIVFVIQGTL